MTNGRVPVAPPGPVLAERSDAGYGTVVDASDRLISGSGDDSFDRPTVTPVPAPPDDQLIRLAKVGSIAGSILGLVVLRWLHKHIEIRWRQ